MELLKAVSQISELYFFILSRFFSRLRFSHVPRFDITQVIYVSGSISVKHLYNQHMLLKCSAEFYIKRLTNLSLIETLIINDKKGIKE